MDAKICDRCCQYFRFDKNGSSYIEYGVKNRTMGISSALQRADLCPICVEAFEKWLRMQTAEGK